MKDLPIFGFLRQKLKSQQLEAIRPQPTNRTYSAAFGATFAPSKEPNWQPNEAIVDHRVPPVHRAVGQYEQLMKDGKLESSLGQIHRSVEQRVRHRVRQRAEQWNSNNSRSDRLGSRSSEAFGNDGERVQSFGRMVYGASRPVGLRLTESGRFAGNPIHLEEEQTTRPPLTRQELEENSNEIIKKEYLGYWTRLNLVKLYSQIANIKRRIGLQTRIYPIGIQP